MVLATSFPNSAFSYGFGVDDVVTGDRYYVDSGSANASDGNLGTRPEKPLATYNGANTRATANNGDYVYLMPGHVETISADAATSPGPDMTVAGVTVVGLGVGSDRPTFTFDDTAADFKMNAANCKIHNILFVAGVASQVMGIEVSGDDCEISHCEFRNDSSFEMLIAVNIGIASNDADRFYIHDCRFISDTAGSTSAVSMTALQAGVRIEDNYARGDYSDAAIQSAVIHTDCVVKGNYLQNDNNTAHAIQFSTTSTGVISGNIMVTDAIGTSYDQGSCFDGGGNVYYDDGDTDVAGMAVPLAQSDVATGGTASIGEVNDTTTDSLHGKIGTDTEMSDSSLFDMITTVDGFHDVPTADATTDTVMRDVIGRKTDTASNVVVATDSLMSYLKGLHTNGVRVLQSTAVGTTTTPKTLFTITGGSIRIISIVGQVVTQIANTATTQQLQGITTAPATTTNMSTAVDTDDDDVGTIYTFVGPSGILTPTTAGVVLIDNGSVTLTETQWVVAPGVIGVDSGAVGVGDVDWIMTYYHNPAATVVAA